MWLRCSVTVIVCDGTACSVQSGIKNENIRVLVLLRMLINFALEV